MPIRIQKIRFIQTAPDGINLGVVKVDTNQDGLYGVGCATFSYRQLAVRTVVEEYLSPLLEGRDPRDISEIWQLIHQNAYWRNGPIENNAISGVDMALWDIVGKMAGMPLYQLLGGKVRAGVPIYRHAEGRDIPEVCDQIRAWMAEGVTHLRCQMGGYGGNGYGPAPAAAPHGALDGVYLDNRKYIRDTVALMEGIRREIGPELQICHDVHSRLHPDEALDLAAALEPCRLFFLEDPLPPDRLDWYPRLRQRTCIPIAQGELFNHPLEWKTLIERGHIDFVRAHITQLGGITPAKKLQTLAACYGVRTAWHGPGDMSPVGHAANIHLDTASPNFGIQEWSGVRPPNFVIQKLSDNPGALAEVFPGMLVEEKGYVYPNDRPGIGVDINEAAAKKYPPCHNVTRWTQTRLQDGALQSP